jgi:glycosyltransferase involved in cell wall biosynthesis
MRILYVIAQLSRGGQERQLVYLLSAVDKELITPYVFVWNLNVNEANYSEITKLGITILGSQKISWLGKLFTLRKILRDYKIDIAHSYTFYLNFILYLSTIATKTKGIGGLRHMLSASIGVHGRLMGALNSLFPNITIVNNHIGGQQLRRAFFGIKSRSVIVITNKIDISNLTYKNLKKCNKFHSVSIGSLMPLKRVDLLIRSIYLLSQAGLDIRHSHAGDGRLKSELNQLINDLGLQNRFILLGEISNVNELINDCDVFLHAADAEGTPNVIMEALACGRPVVSTDCGDARYLVDDSKYGFIVPVGKFDLLAEKAKLLLENEQLRIEMGAKARTFAQSNFNVFNLFKENYTVYTNVLNINRGDRNSL